ncbi:MAG: cupin domain-containing protein [Calditrichaeota bacterium]|nr:MAG: cupin domain-containing protein [Calditrichota bacterium]
MAFVKKTEIPLETVAPGMTRQIMGYDSELMLVKVNFEKGAIGYKHAHHHQQVSYVVSGAFEVEIDGNKQVLQTGDAFVIPSNVEHGAVCLEAGVLIDTFSPQREDFLEE